MSNGVAGIVRINPDGTHDTNFIPAIQTLVPSAVAELPDGKVLAAGIFLGGTNQSRRVLVRMNSEPLVIESWNHSARELRLRGPSGRWFVLEGAANLFEWQPIVTNVFTTVPFAYSNPAPILPASQFYRTRLMY